MLIAHRGIHNNQNIPENSLMAFKKAIYNKYAIELDIGITKDNKLIVFHDENLFRMTNLNQNISAISYKEIRKLKLLNTNEKIPNLKEVLDLVNGKVLLDIEIKNTKKVNTVVDLVLKTLENYRGEVILKSFNPLIVRRLKKKTDKYKIGLLIINKSNNKKLNFLIKSKLIYLFKFDFLAINKKMLNRSYYNRYKKKYPFYVWTMNSLKEVDKYQKKYPDLIYICNNLDT